MEYKINKSIKYVNYYNKLNLNLPKYSINLQLIYKIMNLKYFELFKVIANIIIHKELI